MARSPHRECISSPNLWKTQTLAALIGSLALTLMANAGALASSGGGSPPFDPSSEPSFAQYTAGWTTAQFAAYAAKSQAVSNFAQARASGGVTANCPLVLNAQQLPICVPRSHYAGMTIVWEGSNDCACGPATASEMYSTFNRYYGTPNESLTGMENEMSSKGWYSCAVGTWRTGLMYEMNIHQKANAYALAAISSGTDVYNYTAIDLGLYNFPVAYDGETYGKYGHPLDNYSTVDWGHYFPAYGYDVYANVYVADPHYAYDHHYTATAAFKFIANFSKLSPQVIW